MQSLIMSVFDYGDVLYMCASAAILKLLDAVYHSALHFMTGNGSLNIAAFYMKEWVWPSLTMRRE